MRLEYPQAGNIQQGAIFNCVVVSRYEKCKCHGIVLTARCDLAHQKYSVISYLPIVRFSDWVQREMSYLLAKRLHADFTKSITKTLISKRVSEKVQGTYPLKEIILKESKGKEQATLLDKCNQIDLLLRVISLGGRFCPEWKSVIQIEVKQCDSVIKELIQQKLGEYYFLDGVDIFDESTEGHVILLRNMQTMEIDVMEKIVAGISVKDFTDSTTIPKSLTFGHESDCMITGVLRSPDIEHLAQQFATLFVRIGLEDYNESTYEQHSQIAKGN
jgi:hypothetical protein